MSEDDVLFGYRLQLVDLAGRIGVAPACRAFGIHRSTYYRWKRMIERHGLEILRPRERRRPRMPNQLSPLIEGRIVAFALGLPLAVGAFAAGLFCAVATGYLKDNSRIKEDTVMGIVFSGMFGFGLVLFTKVETDQHLLHILFGNMLGVTARDLIETAVIAGGTLIIVLLKRRDFLLYCFDPNHARAIGLPVRLLQYGLLVLLSITIVAALKAVGIILVIAMLVAPGATAYLLTDSFERMLVIATGTAVASSALGTIASFHIDGATGACIVLIQAALFVLAFLFGPKRGLVWVWGRRHLASKAAPGALS